MIIILLLYFATLAWTLYTARKRHASIGRVIPIIYAVLGIVLIYLTLASMDIVP